MTVAADGHGRGGRGGTIAMAAVPELTADSNSEAESHRMAQSASPGDTRVARSTAWRRRNRSSLRKRIGSKGARARRGAIFLVGS